MSPLRTEKGFTLLEVLLAVTLMALLLGVVYTSFFVIHDAASSTSGAVVSLQEARATLDMMRREIEAGMSAGSGGGHDFEVMDRDIFGKKASSLSFDSHASPLPGGAAISYEVKEVDEAGEAGEARLVLMKYVGRLEGSAPGQDSEPVEVEAVEDIVSFDVEALVGRRTYSTWREHRQPEAIRVTLTIKLHGADVPLGFTASPYIGKTL